MTAKRNSQKALYRSISQRYLLGILIIALLSTSAYYTLKSALSDSDNTAYIVNLSGRQRMLSQHIALDAHRIYADISIGSEPASELSALMHKNISDMGKANAQLSSNLIPNSRPVDLSITLRELYFGEMKLYDRVGEYLSVANKLLNSTDQEEARVYLGMIDNRSEQLLTDLNTAVNQYQLEGEERLHSIETLELVVWIATLIALVLEIFFIFRPMALMVISSLKSQDRAMEQLEEIVESRTLKLEIANKKLQDAALHDPLTKLRNRLTLESDIESLINVSEEDHIHFACCMIDIDWFKKINDSLGHSAGDYVLQQLALLMKAETREYDRIYRAGGEEFVLVLSRVTYEESVAKLERLRHTIQSSHFEYEGESISLTISGGLYHSSLFPLSSAKDIMREADVALYAAKNSGRNCIRTVDKESRS